MICALGGAGPGFGRWDTCGLCEQGYHGVVACALGWACWKTYVGRPETDVARRLAMGLLGNGLSQTNQNEDALSVREALLATQLRLGAPEEDVFVTQSNLASTYRELGLVEKASNMLRNVYSGRVRLKGEEDQETIIAALNYASNLGQLRRFEEAKSLLRKIMPVARRILGETHEITLRTRKIYAQVLYMDTSVTPDDLREAVTTLEDTDRTARRVFGDTHPLTVDIEGDLINARGAIADREMGYA